MKGRILLTMTSATLLASASASADSIPLEAVNKANAVIDAAIEAHGGSDALDSLDTLAQSSKYTNYAVGQSRRPGQPWDQSSQDNFAAIDVDKEVYVTRNAGEGGGFEFSNATIINGEESYQLDYRRGTAAPIAEPDFATASGPTVRVTPPLLMQQLSARRNTSHWLGETEVDGRPHDIVTLVMAVGPALSLYIDQQTHLLTRMERVLPPFGQIEYAFLDYEQVDGIAFNKRFELYVNGDPNLVIEDIEYTVNGDLAKYTAVPSELQLIPPVTPNAFGSQEIDEGVFLIGGSGAYGLFVEMDDYVVAIGGTQGVSDRIEALREAVPDKPIRYGVLTHHHSDHVPGTADYVAEGATVITVSENEEVVRAAAGDREAELQFVDGRLTLGSGDRRVEIYDVGPTPHVESLLIAYLPKEGIIFEADHFPQPQTGPMPPAVPATVAFAAAINRLGLDYKVIVGAHSPRLGSPEDLAAMLNHATAVDSAGSR